MPIKLHSRFYIYFIASLAFLTLPFLFSPDLFSGKSLFHISGFLRNLLGYVFLLGFFFAIHFWATPRLFFPKKYAKFGVFLVFSIVFILGMPHLIVRDDGRRRPMHSPIHSPFEFDDNRPPPPDFIHFGGDEVVLVVLFVLICFLSLFLVINQRLREAEQNRLQSETSQLKAQINPHFLFNTLNSIYSSAIIENAPIAAAAIINLSDMMRYVLTDAQQEFVSLKQELNYINTYIALQHLRLQETVEINYTHSQTHLNQHIAPLILISFIENAFKYGVNPDRKATINIEIELLSNLLTFKCSNEKITQPTDTLTNTGLGLTNTVQRLNLLYPNRHELLIRDETTRFNVFLSLVL